MLGVIMRSRERRRRKRANRMTKSVFFRPCGVGAVLAGILFLVWGYVDKPHISPYLDAVVNVMSFVVPALFLVGLVGFSVLHVSRIGALGRAGLIITFCGPAWGLAEGLASAGPLHAILAELRLPLYLIGWLLPMLTGLTIVGIATLLTRNLRSLGGLVLAMGGFGWIYYLTDSSAILEARLVHVGFGLLFGLSWVMLGRALWEGGTRQTDESHA